MKRKSINQMWGQLGRIRNYFQVVPTKEEVIKLNNACLICNRYVKSAADYLRAINKFDINTPIDKAIYAD